MIKRIIFDLDNTLIMWKDEYLNALKETMELYNIKEDYKYINLLIDEYDNKFEYYDKELLLNYINNRIKYKIDINILNTFLDKFGYMSQSDNKVINVLEYLSKKYELVVLTNWFQKPQENRLKNAEILKYFKEVIGGEISMKPYKKAFINACGKYLPKECLMIGDDYDKDIVGADNAGLNVIYFNYKNQENSKYKEIKDLEELKEML